MGNEQRRLELFCGRRPDAPLVMLMAGPDEGRTVWEAARAETDADFALAAFQDLAWNDDLSPWPMPPLEKGEEGFGGGAKRFLGWLTDRALPQIIAALGGTPAYTAVAGYSLGGLFALYALSACDAFDRAASASGSLWYPDFVDYARKHPPRRMPACVYLSVGNRERRAQYTVMRCVEDETRRMAAWYREIGAPVMLEINPGGHFKEPERRMGRAVARMLEGPSGFYFGRELD